MTLAREDEALVEQAKAILSLNWTGEYTQPGPTSLPAPVVLGLGLRGLRLRPLQSRTRREGTQAPLRGPVVQRPLAPDRLQPALPRLLPGTQLLERQRKPERPEAQGNLGRGDAAHPRARRAGRLQGRRNQGVLRVCLPQTRGLARVPLPREGPGRRGTGLHPPSLGVGDGQLPDVGFHPAAITSSGGADPQVRAGRHPRRQRRGSPG